MKTGTQRAAASTAAFLLAWLAAPAVCASVEAGPAAADALSGSELVALFSPETDPAARSAVRSRAIRLAMGGDARASFDLGVLFRHGMAHPARAVDQDLDTARHWLTRCVELPRCPPMALASLAELELDAGRHLQAMQWAQAWVAVTREARKRAAAPERPEQTAYAAHLLRRCYEYLPKVGREGAVAAAFADFNARHGRHLDRMVAEDADRRVQAHEQAPLNAARHNPPVTSPRTPQTPAEVLYLVEAMPQGGRVSRVVLIEALPTLRAGVELANAPRRMETRPFEARSPTDRRYAFVPVMYVDPRFRLVSAD